jgi:hypothetical protein
MKVLITKITPWFPRKVAIQWDVEECRTSGVLQFYVERAGSPGGPWVRIASNLLDEYLYEDDLNTESINVLALNRDIYYRIGASAAPAIGPTDFSDPTNLDGQTSSVVTGPEPIIGYTVDFRSQYEPPPQTQIMPRPDPRARKRLLRRKILRDEYIVLKKLNGIEFYLLKRRHYGVRCPVCYEPATRNVTRSACPTCFGTSWTGGYFTEVFMYGRKLPSQIQAQEAAQTKVETNQTRIQFLDFPRIDEEDILVEKNTNKRFLVRSRYFTSLKTIPVHQTVTVSEFERQAVEYKIPVNL